MYCAIGDAFIDALQACHVTCEVADVMMLATARPW